MKNLAGSSLVEEMTAFIPPEDIFLRIKKLPFSFFLDSASGSENLSRFSFLGAEPFLVFKSKKGSVTLESSDGKIERLNGNPFLILKDLLKRFRFGRSNAGIPFTSGAVGYFSYDMKDFVERLPDTAKDDMGIPDCMLGFYGSVIVSDNLRRKTYIAGLSKDGIGRYGEILSAPGDGGAALKALTAKLALKSNFSKGAYMAAVDKAKRYIRKGDIYQANLSQRFEADLPIPAPELYMRLRHFSPAPFSAYLGFGDLAIVSSSPERFLLKDGSYIETRPIKGTRPRGSDSFEDAMLEKELKESAKDRAEHIMIVDLERNDLGRICEYGTVRPRELFVLERYSTVFHLVSTVCGRLKEGVDPVDCLLATFPGGSITGAPKIRSMEIIEELEPVKRSVYTGALGYISFDGDMDTSIVIRTFVAKGGKAYFQVGGGIVADSDPEKEYDETLVKAKGMMQALGVEKADRELVWV